MLVFYLRKIVHVSNIYQWLTRCALHPQILIITLESRGLSPQTFDKWHSIEVVYYSKLTFRKSCTTIRSVVYQRRALEIWQSLHNRKECTIVASEVLYCNRMNWSSVTLHCCKRKISHWIETTARCCYNRQCTNSFVSDFRGQFDLNLQTWCLSWMRINSLFDNWCVTFVYEGFFCCIVIDFL